MAEKILNGSFGSGFTYWTNPTGGGQAYTLDAGKAKAISSASSAAGIMHAMKQQFNNMEYVVGAHVWVWAQWSVPSGDVSNGSCNFRIELADPNNDWHLLKNETKTPGSGSGFLLSNFDITEYFDVYGNLQLNLECTPASAKQDNSTSISNPYTSWEKYGTYMLYESNNKVKAVSSSSDGNTYSLLFIKSFTVDKATYDARISASVKGIKSSNPGAKAHGKIYLEKPDHNEVTLWEGDYSDGAWHQALNNADIKSYVQQTGTYKLKLHAEVASGWKEDPGIWIPSEFHFDDVSLTAKWYTYERASGWYDNISLIVLCKYYKVVKEDLGAGESKQSKALLNEKEDVGLGESYASVKFKPGAASEPLGLQEVLSKKVFLVAKEDLGLNESYYAPNEVEGAKEDLGLTESYFTNRQVPKSASESLGLSERLWARIVRGNLVIDYDLTTETNWTSLPWTTTPWIKRKVIVD